MERGRPLKQDQVKLRKILLEHWGKGHSAGYAAKLEKVNIKTVTEYYKEFNEEIVEKVDEDFIVKQKAVKFQTLTQMDELIAESQKQLEGLKAKCEEDPDNSSWESIKASVIKDQMLFLQEKSNLEITPTLDINLDKLVEETS